MIFFAFENSCVAFDKCIGIYVEISGKAHCHWTEGMGKRKKCHTGNESYLQERSYFAGGRDGK